MKRLAIALLAACTCAAAWAAGDFRQTIRAVELKSAPNADAAAVTSLPEKTRVEVLKREGAWYEVKAAQSSGWLRMLSVRAEGDAARGKSGDGALSGLRNLVTGGSGKPAVATGVRGLSETDLRNAQPNPQELEKLLELSAGPEQARRFAAEIQLKSRTLAYLPEVKEKGAAK